MTKKADFQKLFDLGYQSHEIDKLIENDILTKGFLEQLDRYYQYRADGNAGFGVDISQEIGSIVEKLDIWSGSLALNLEEETQDYIESFVGPLSDAPEMQQGRFMTFVEWNKSRDQYGRAIGDTLQDRDGKEFHPGQVIGKIHSRPDEFEQTRGEIETAEEVDDIQAVAIARDLGFIGHTETLEKKISRDLRGIGEAETISDKIQKDFENIERPQSLGDTIEQDLRSIEHER